MKLTQSELYDALGLLIDKIEACGASVELTNAVVLTGCIRQSIGNEFNPASAYAADAVRGDLRAGKPIKPADLPAQMSPAPDPTSPAMDGKRLLCMRGTYEVYEIRLIEHSPSGKYALVERTNGNISWIECAGLRVIEVLKEK